MVNLREPMGYIMYIADRISIASDGSTMSGHLAQWDTDHLCDCIVRPFRLPTISLNIGPMPETVR